MSLLARHLGSEEAADAARREMRLRKRMELRAALSRDLKALEREQQQDSPAPYDFAGLFRAEFQRFRSELPDIIQAEVRRILADELPEALDYLTHRQRGDRNGTPAQATGR